jgi:hypothetical protein
MVHDDINTVIKPAFQKKKKKKKNHEKLHLLLKEFQPDDPSLWSQLIITFLQLQLQKTV